MYLVVGLGNPGDRYARTYHNLGFIAAELLAEKAGLKKFKNKGYMALTSEGTVAGNRAVIAKPVTYMNLSGDSVKSLLSAYRLPIENLLVIYDDVDIPKGSVRLRENGSAGTHNGMKSIIDCLRTSNFKRVRIGAGPVPEFYDISDYVLSGISRENVELIHPAMERAVNAAFDFISGTEFVKVMNKYNA